MKKSIKSFLASILSVSLFISSGCTNPFKEAAKKDSDEAKLEDIRKMLNDKKWDEALAQLEALSDFQKSQVSVIETWASVYAGKCGLDFIAYFDALGSADLSSSSMFKYFMNAFTGVSVSPADCQLAQEKIEEISVDPAERSSGQNLFMAILGMVKIGTNLRGIADTDGTGGLGDGTTDGGFDACNMTQAQANAVMTGVGLITSNLTALTDTLSDGSITDALGDLNTVCAGNCGKTDSSLVTDPERLLLINLVATSPTNPNPGQNLGIGSCTNDISNPATLCCFIPPP